MQIIPAIDGLDDASQTRVVLYQSGRFVHAPALGIGLQPLGRFETVSAVESENISSSLDSIQTDGYTTPGDGGAALYKRVETEPGHDLKIQSADGAWWEHADTEIRLQQVGPQTDATVFGKAVLAGRAMKKKVLLPEGDIAIDQRINLPDLFDDYIDIEGPGSGLCRLVPSEGYVYSSLMVLSSPLATPGNTVEFPDYGNQTATEAEQYATMVDDTAELGSYQVLVRSGHGLQVGDIIRMKSTRMDVQRCESRGAIFRGELNRVVAVNGNLLTLEYPLSDRYFDITSTTGFVTASGTTSTTVNISALSNLPSQRSRCIGVRMVVTDGTGAGQVRYIEELSSNDIADIATHWNSSYPQAPFSPVLDGTSQIRLEWQCYINYIRPGDTAVRLKGFSVWGYGQSVLVSTGTIQGVVEPVVEDVKFLGTRDYGIGFINCIRPRLIGGTAQDCNTTSLGYGALFTECRDSKSDGFDALNCRAGIDCSGTIKSVTAHIRGGSMVGGYADFDGLAWDINNPNRGPGDHGQSLDWTWENIVVDGFVNHCVQRGTRVAFRNIRHLGLASGSYYLLAAGLGTTIIGHDLDARIEPLLDNFPSPASDAGGNFIRILGRSCAGDLYVGPGNINGLVNSFIKIRDASQGLGWLRNVRIARQNIRARTKLAPDVVYMVDTESDSFTPVDWSIERPNVIMDGPGSFRLLSGLSFGLSTAPSKISIDDSWVIAIPDDGVVSIPFFGDVGSSQVQIVLFDRQADASLRCNALLRRESAVFSATNFGGTTANIVALATQPGGTSGVDGNLSLFYNGTQVFIENRLGSARVLCVKLSGY